MTDDCGLCLSYNEDDYRIIKKDENAVSLVITNPINPGHLMILPRRHILRLDDISPEESKSLNEILYDSQQRLKNKFKDHPPIHFMQTGKHSTQPHIHYQMLPSDAHGRKLYAAAHYPSGEAIPQPKHITNPPYDRQKLEDIAKSLR